MKHTGQMLGTFLANAVKQELAYRADFVLNLLNVILGTLASTAILAVMFAHRRSVGGWAFAEVLVLMGLFRIFKSYIEVFLMPNVGRIPELVRRGDLDFVLLKPVDSQFMVSCRHFDWWRLPEALVGLALMGIGWSMAGIPFSLAGVGAAALLALSGAVTLYALWLLFMTTSFWFVDIRNLPVVLTISFEFAQFPVSAFPGSLSFALVYVVPIAFVTTVPASALLGRVQPAAAMAGVGVALLLLAASRLFWRYAVRRYTSASS